MTAAATVSSIAIRDADQASKLDAIAGSGGCDAGTVLALDFAAVRSAMGDRWATRRDDVHRRIESAIAREVSRSAIVLRITEAEYLVSFTELQGAAAQVQAFNIMEDLLTYFLGRCDADDLIVNRVSAVTSEGLQMRPLSRSEVEREKLRQDQAAARLTIAAPASTLIEGPAERLDVRLVPQDVLHMPSGLVIGTRMSISIHRIESERLLTPREELTLSTSSLVQTSLVSINGLREVMLETRRPAVFVLPVFLQTITSSWGRMVVLDALRRFRPVDQRRLVVEIAGIERGTPSSRLMEAAWQLRSFCRGVSGRAQLERSALTALTGARLSGIHLSARDLGVHASQRAAGLLAAGQSAIHLAPMIMATDLPDASMMDLCKVAGFTHVTLPPGTR